MGDLDGNKLDPGIALWLAHDYTFEEIDAAIDVLRSSALPAYLYTPVLQQYGGRLATFGTDRQFSPRSSRNRRPRGECAVFCHVPDYDMLADAERMRRRGCFLVVTESFVERSAGWARAVGAIEFRTGEGLPPFDRSEQQVVEQLGAVSA